MKFERQHLLLVLRQASPLTRSVYKYEYEILVFGESTNMSETICMGNLILVKAPCMQNGVSVV